MTPAAQAFIANYGGVADQVAAGTGLSRWALLVQWGVETALGTRIFNRNNLANIRCSPTTFCQYATLDDFARDCIATFHNGFYNAVLATAGQPVRNQLLAIGASPWDAGHYGQSVCGYAGCALIALWQSDFDSVQDQPKRRRRAVVTVASQNTINMFVRGTDNALWQNRFDGTAWTGWRSLGGRLGVPDIVPVKGPSRLDLFIMGQDNAMYRIGSTDDGVTWSAFENLGGNLSNGTLTAVGEGMVSGTPVDLTPVEQQLTTLTTTVNKIESGLVKAGASLQQA